jgi:ribonuclease BN (tRNA processing enzyme)
MDSLLRLAWGEKLHEIVHERLDLTYIDLAPGETRTIAGFEVHAEEVVHVPDIPCYGYTMSKDGVRFGFSGDSGPCTGVEKLIQESDYFLLEMTGVDDADKSHFSRRAAIDVIKRYPGVTFYLTHLNSRDPVPGALLAADLQTVQRPRVPRP